MALLTINQACVYLNLSRSTLYRLMRSGELGYITVAGRRRIPEEALTKLLEPWVSEPEAKR